MVEIVPPRPHPLYTRDAPARTRYPINPLSSSWSAASGADEGKGRSSTPRRESGHGHPIQGGNNAGHTVITEHGEFKFQLMPSGILNPKCVCIIGNGWSSTPRCSCAKSRSCGARHRAEELINQRARTHGMSYHPLFRPAGGGDAGDDVSATTWRGIGLAYADKVRRIGFRIGDLQKEPSCAKKLASSSTRSRTRS